MSHWSTDDQRSTVIDPPPMVELYPAHAEAPKQRRERHLRGPGPVAVLSREWNKLNLSILSPGEKANLAERFSNVSRFTVSNYYELLSEYSGMSAL